MKRVASMHRLLLSLSFVAASAFCMTPAFAELAGERECPAHMNTPPSTINLSSQGFQIHDAILCLINAERQKLGIAKVTLSEKLTNAAQAHATSSGERRWWNQKSSHFNADDPIPPPDLDEEELKRRINAAIHARIVAAGYCNAAPKWASEITYTGSNDDSTAKAAVNWWMNSPDHFAQISAANFQQIGVGLSGMVANGNDPVTREMGTYVVTFGECATNDPPPQRPEDVPVSPPPVSAAVKVTIQGVKANDCPEVFECDWKVHCRLETGPSFTEWVEVVRRGTAGSDEVVPLLSPNITFNHDGRPPVTLMCQAWERDGESIFSDAVWEHIGFGSSKIDNGTPAGQTAKIRINQNTEEGDVTLDFRAEVITSSSSGLTTPTPHPPAAPRSCAQSGGGTCGSISFTCERPLSTAEILVSGGGGGGIRVYQVARGIGHVGANYQSEGNYSVAVCARNEAGSSCGNRFDVSLGPPVCAAGGSIPRPCPGDEIQCDGACKPINQCTIER